eukprot:TRINITY_DN94834_c0_g1_i1.p1 TRINITY_DN94834_c0_g1~~TRINITY_DN94834_c0_g1_i1.p1  ORF type:complete len:167 (-),score=19.65 TRINITY_DN94834_c0_g1_i1:211-711(-)
MGQLPCLEREITSHGQAVSCTVGGLLRASHHPFAVGDLQLQISIALPLAGGVPEAVLYVLDAEPELFAVAATHLYGRTGYCLDKDDPKYSPLRRVAVIGVGHDPACWGMSDTGWDIGALRELRRRDYWQSCSNFMNVLVTRWYRGQKSSFSCQSSLLRRGPFLDPR